ncbi:TPA: phage portal protein [Klebsiella pneumoniae]
MRKIIQKIKTWTGIAPLLDPTPTTTAPIVRDPFPGAWQRGVPPIRQTDPLDVATTFACVNRIAGDISLMTPRLQVKRAGVWQDAPTNNTYLALPNGYQTVSQFWEKWTIDLLTHGSAYIYQGATGWHLIKPETVRLLIDNRNGGVWYETNADAHPLAGLGSGGVQIPAVSMMHARINCLRHPLIGVPPVYAAALAGQLGENAKHAAELAYANSSRPGGIVEVPGAVDSEKLREIKAAWEGGYSGANRDKTAVLADGMRFTPYPASNLVDAELIAALKLSASQIAAIFGIPPYRVAAGSYPTYAGQSQADQQYLTGTLQKFITQAEEITGAALGLTGSTTRRVHFDTAPLLRLDPQTQISVLGAAVSGSFMSVNEARARIDLPPVDGGEEPRAQQQYLPLSMRGLPPAANDPEPQPVGKFVVVGGTLYREFLTQTTTGAITYPGDEPPPELEPDETPDDDDDDEILLDDEILFPGDVLAPDETPPAGGD